MVNRKLRKSLLVLCSSSTVAYYDFFIMVLLAPYLSKAFFPNSTSNTSIFTIYAASTIFMPIGSIVWGHFADKYGRKSCLISSYSLIILSTLLIAVIPGRQYLGQWGALLLFVFRSLQGFALGGDTAISATLVAESSSDSNRTLNIGAWLGATCLGTLLATSTTWLLMKQAPYPIMITWGWRIPFLLGGVAMIILLMLRGFIAESPISFNNANETKSWPILVIIQSYIPAIITGVCLELLSSYLIGFVTYVPTYLNNLHNLSTKSANFSLLYGLLLLIFLYPLSGLLADKYGKQKILSIFAISSILLGPLSLVLLNSNNLTSIITAILTLKVLTSATTSSALCQNIENFPPEIRVSAVGIINSICIGLIALVPLSSHFLTEILQDIYAPAYLLVICAAITCLTILTSRDKSAETQLLSSKN
ncbi:MFS transporter [Piscirickettsia litoralis]|uniref:Major facilitator superfamily (MFS) profile domain-containing protein n=1 Tax=Piscirickettsia litoralis TaxID=1891921 RepID=A0ABX3A0K7_9GAMM|nr:MFS transporter [Piscirickettsia litoralis]ODN42394.1 hypothetical protein BGC07_04920 [Piscirickettsia litoralis]